MACGGAGTTGLGDGGSDSGNDSAGNDGGNDATANDAGGDAAACPNEHGLYSVTFSGQGCGTIATTAPICIQEATCTITLSTAASGGSNEVSGTTPIGGDGSFTGAAINQGQSSRSGCVGSWNQGTSTLTIDCGGTNMSQSCEATLVRTAANCN